MKKLIILILFLVLNLFTGCRPADDIEVQLGSVSFVLPELVRNIPTKNDIELFKITLNCVNLEYEEVKDGNSGDTVSFIALKPGYYDALIKGFDNTGLEIFNLNENDIKIEAGYNTKILVVDLEASMIVNEDITPEPSPSPTQAPLNTPGTWTIMVYLNGDSEYEKYAIEDMNEMEAVNLTGTGINVVVLLDRIYLYDDNDDTSNGNWADTRLFHVQYDEGGDTNIEFTSTELDSTELWPAVDATKELNMGHPSTCENFIDFCKNNYPAKDYFLVFSDHRTNWDVHYGKAVCYDKTVKDLLYVKEIGDSVEGKEITVLGFDTCKHAMIEVAYEFRNDVSYMIASEDDIDTDGWEYDDLLNYFLLSNQAEMDLIKSVIDSYSIRYENIPGATISGIYLSQIGNIMDELNSFSDMLYNSITNRDIQQDIGDTLSEEVEDFINIKPLSSDNDLNLDIWHMADVIATKYDYADTQAIKLKNAIDSSVVYKWHNPEHGEQGNPYAHGLAIYCMNVNFAKKLTGFNPWYANGDNYYYYSLKFVLASTWIPHYHYYIDENMDEQIDWLAPGLLYRIVCEWFP